MYSGEQHQVTVCTHFKCPQFSKKIFISNGEPRTRGAAWWIFQFNPSCGGAVWYPAGSDGEGFGSEGSDAAAAVGRAPGSPDPARRAPAALSVFVGFFPSIAQPEF